ncbi:MAG: hypothetical protein DMG36_19100, partial [Acidobacteria bacterium]
ACEDKTYAYDCPRSFAIYRGPLVQAILLLKFEQIELWAFGLQSDWRSLYSATEISSPPM